MNHPIKSITCFLLVGAVYLLMLTTVGFSQDTLKIDSADVIQYKQGNYRIVMFLNQGRSSPPDTHFETLLKNPNNYVLKEKKTETQINLPAVQLGLGNNDNYQITLSGVNITHKKKYSIEFRSPLPTVEPMELVFSETESVLKKWENGKAMEWQSSITPKIAQGDSAISELGDMGFNFVLSRQLPGKFEFNFDGSLTLNKDDPTNHWNLKLFWRPVDLLLDNSGRIGFRPSISLEENANQALRFHEISIRAFASFFLHPFNGIQPVFITAGIDEVFRLNLDGEDSDDPRIQVQVQWGMVGLLGKGSSFFISWRFWHRLRNFGDVRINPSEREEPQYIQLEFVLPIMDGKNLSIKYAEGEFAPTFVSNRSIQLGLEFLFGNKPILLPTGSAE
jgi:hypothetical protein